MKNQIPGQVIGIPISSTVYPAEMPREGSLCIACNQYYASPKFRQSTIELMKDGINKLGMKVENFAQGIRDHVKIGPKLSETVRGKLRLGAKILRVGGVRKVFKQNFSIRSGEKLLKASQCYLSTTAGPIAGLLFISTDRIAFCSERSIKVSTSTGDLIRIHYKVSVPLNKIKRANESENVQDPSRKYIDIVTEDDYEFWFMGFLNHQRTYKFLQLAVYESQ
ncbi:GEM-like protein 7 [Daucus carota subsp. sativus]|uniref:GEM-like protein 7 n=1 Tax=Daucus carota subsp. sativus TaxID=79200 RepID=UPI0007EF9365|nr:PREDICTED: GEM-like protein 7 [Daucus carota subsp. sativus]XP_017224672.1 PREDICTED: GEM-like protein 7 [Daucus carota subsp. sativus]XP_017224673.1 PREDICTED: GEM-like protein 7 [Daucus carota subsp. sativus]XP_017224676.1 PREDICTED: GEM-like protein 7 [Daucus carota subsp. sativus]XP_017224677.1 PREDICTED: GEM-like protein 7 [Daucus carota subsp. sativus]XP_017224678.1 PREDICTED: GEM-like protein 7 [Daucus carota subsp. sativus]